LNSRRHENGGGQKGPEEAKRSPLSPDFPLEEGDQKNLGIRAIGRFSVPEVLCVKLVTLIKMYRKLICDESIEKT
jgi:hypothetical protein